MPERRTRARRAADRDAAHATTAEVAAAIDTLAHLLIEAYGTDYSFTIRGRGQVIASHNAILGHRRPVTVVGAEMPPHGEDR